ncbi:MAG TPA: ISKra4 family transposase, partial [Coleofasciculaceae cyanobacterium]
QSQRQEILDWFHLKENLCKINATKQDLAMVETLLWQGKVDDAIKQVTDGLDEQAQNFINYLTNHRTGIVNYAYFQAEGISISSGTIESTVKPTGARLKLSGAQWKSDNVP